MADAFIRWALWALGPCLAHCSLPGPQRTLPHCQGWGARKQQSGSELSKKDVESLTCSVPGQVTSSKPQFLQGLSFRARAADSRGSLSCSPDSRPAGNSPSQHTPPHRGCDQHLTGGVMETPLSLQMAGAPQAEHLSKGRRSLEPAVPRAMWERSMWWPGPGRRQLAKLRPPCHHGASQRPAVCWALCQAPGQG